MRTVLSRKLSYMITPNFRLGGKTSCMQGRFIQLHLGAPANRLGLMYFGPSLAHPTDGRFNATISRLRWRLLGRQLSHRCHWARRERRNQTQVFKALRANATLTRLSVRQHVETHNCEYSHGCKCRDR
jgi:hypothetical protein